LHGNYRRLVFSILTLTSVLLRFLITPIHVIVHFANIWSVPALKPPPADSHADLGENSEQTMDDTLNHWPSASLVTVLGWMDYGWRACQGETEGGGHWGGARTLALEAEFVVVIVVRRVLTQQNAY